MRLIYPFILDGNQLQVYVTEMLPEEQDDAEAESGERGREETSPLLSRPVEEEEPAQKQWKAPPGFFWIEVGELTQNGEMRYLS